MKKLFCFLSLTIFSTIILSQTKPDDIIGKWYSEEMSQSTVNIYKTEKGEYEGKYISTKKAEHIGHRVFSEFKFNASEQLWVGITTTGSGMVIKSKLYLLPDGKLKLVGKKYFITKTYLFKKS